jgi:hypothetical protein
MCTRCRAALCALIDDTLTDGPAILTGDFDGNGRNQIVVGYRGGSHTVNLYVADAAGKNWTKSLLDDGGMSAAAFAIADPNGDGPRSLPA